MFTFVTERQYLKATAYDERSVSADEHRGGDVPPHTWGVTTRKGNKLFVHILDLPDKGLFLPLEAKVTQAKQFIDNTAVPFRQDKDGVWLQLPKVPDDIDYVVELTLK